MIPIEPDRSQFSIVFSLVDFDPFEEHFGYINFLDPNGKEVVETDEFNLPAEQRENEDEDEDKLIISGVSMGVDFGIQFERPGLYKAVLHFDEEMIGEFYIPVMRKGSEE